MRLEKGKHRAFNLRRKALAVPDVLLISLVFELASLNDSLKLARVLGVSCLEDAQEQAVREVLLRVLPDLVGLGLVGHGLGVFRLQVIDDFLELAGELLAPDARVGSLLRRLIVDPPPLGDWLNYPLVES